MSVFEQYLLVKLWFSQATQALAQPASEGLLKNHIEHANSYLLFDCADVIKQLHEKQGLQVPEPSDQVVHLLEQGRPEDIYNVIEGGEIVIDINKKNRNEKLRS